MRAKVAGHSSGAANSQVWVERVGSVGRYGTADRRAPYKPLLLLWVIGRKANGQPTRISFSEAEEPLRALLDKHRFAKSDPKPQDPFVYLGSDRELWRVETASGDDVTTMRQDTKSKVSFLRGQGVTGRFAPVFDKALEDTELRSQIVNELLTAFPETLHREVLEEVGLAHAVALVPPKRDPAFRGTVLLAYENTCAFCGFDGSLRGVAVAIDAAHVKMRSFNGPDDPDNGIALCVLHHRLFDRGAMGLDEDLRMLVSQHMIVREGRTQMPVTSLVGRPMRRPQAAYHPPDINYVNWHYENVFVSPPRTTAPPGSRHPSARGDNSTIDTALARTVQRC